LLEADCYGTDTWHNALNNANNLEDGQCGLSDGSAPGDWRLPNIQELLSLADYTERNPSLPNNHPFVRVQTDCYFTSTTNQDYVGYAGSLDFYYSSSYSIGPDVDSRDKDTACDMWPVKGGL
jgi:hypothetical protein